MQGSAGGGSIPSTFLASKAGTTTISPGPFGQISLRPSRDYADSGSATTYVANRYANELHEYHEFLNAGWDNTINRTGTLITIQAKSGQTNGVTPGTDFNYDSKGDATLRIKTHNSDSTVKSQWDIEANQASGNLSIINSLNEGSPTTIMAIDGTTADFTVTVASPAATSTSAVINFIKPTVIGTYTTPITANITDSLTGAKLGTVQKIYHNHSVLPTFPAGWVKLGDNDYLLNALNIIYCEWSEGTRVEYWIVQEA